MLASEPGALGGHRMEQIVSAGYAVQRDRDRNVVLGNKNAAVRRRAEHAHERRLDVAHRSATRESARCMSMRNRLHSLSGPEAQGPHWRQAATTTGVVRRAVGHRHLRSRIVVLPSVGGVHPRDIDQRHSNGRVPRKQRPALATDSPPTGTAPGTRAAWTRIELPGSTSATLLPVDHLGPPRGRAVNSLLERARGLGSPSAAQLHSGAAHISEAAGQT